MGSLQGGGSAAGPAGHRWREADSAARQQFIVWLGGEVDNMCPTRLEELSEARQGVVARVKAAERERDALEGARAVATAYLGKDRECTAAQATIFQIFIRDGQVPRTHACTPACLVSGRPVMLLHGGPLQALFPGMRLCC